MFIFSHIEWQYTVDGRHVQTAPYQYVLFSEALDLWTILKHMHVLDFITLHTEGVCAETAPHQWCAVQSGLF